MLLSSLMITFIFCFMYAIFSKIWGMYCLVCLSVPFICLFIKLLAHLHFSEEELLLLPLEFTLSSICELLGQMLKSWNFNPLVFFLHFIFFIVLIKPLATKAYGSCASVDLGIYVFSSPEPKARVSYCHSAPSVVRLSVCLSVVRP